MKDKPNANEFIEKLENPGQPDQHNWGLDDLCDYCGADSLVGGAGSCEYHIRLQAAALLREQAERIEELEQALTSLTKAKDRLVAQYARNGRIFTAPNPKLSPRSKRG